MNEKRKPSKYLFLGAHLDDVELGCGGLISRLMRTKSSQELRIVCLSHFNRDSSGQFVLKRDLDESLRAIQLLGCEPGCLTVESFPGQLFPDQSHRIREYLLTLRNNYGPDRIFYPSHSDVHQDHEVLSREAFRVFRNHDCFGYEIVRSTIYFRPNLYIELDIEDVERKVASVGCYHSQLEQSAGYYFGRETTESLLRTYGARRGCPFAEAYEIDCCGG